MFNFSLPPMVSAETTAALLELMRFYTNQGNIKDNVDRIDCAREQYLAAKKQFEDLESRAAQVETDRMNFTNAIETRDRDLTDREETLKLSQAAFEVERDGVRAALQKDREEMDAAKQAFDAEKREWDADVAAVRRLRGGGPLQG